MNERTRYEQSLADQLSNLQLPEEDRAWLAMKKLLDEKDDDGAVILPPPRRGCGLWGVAFLLVLVAGGIYFFTKQEPSGNKLQTKISEKSSQGSNTNSGNNLNGIESSGHITQTGVIGGDSINSSSNMNQVTGTRGGVLTSDEDAASVTLTNQKNKTGTRPRSNKKTSSTDNARSAILVTPGKGEEGSDAEKYKKSSGNTDAVQKMNINPGKTEDINQTSKKNGIAPDPEIVIGTDSNQVNLEIESDTASKATDSLKIEIEKSDSSTTSEDSIPQKKKGFSFAVGIAEQHAFPINGTESVSNGLLGRKSTFADYIPSLYLRLYRENRWFFQSEFKYGAPQYVKGFAYRNIVEIDTTQSVSTRTFFLRKTFYHQLPLSFHYFVVPGWSVGTGLVFNRFQGTISEESLRLRFPGTTIDTIVETKVIDHKQDSSFKKNTWQWMVETQYKWKRFSVGARYSQGLQPYIEYTDLQGEPQSKKHQSFNVFIRYELWRSKQK